MNKLLIAILAILCLPLGLTAQTPYNFNYQGVARNASGQPLSDQSIQLKLSVMDSSDVVYSERQALTTNDFGLFTAVIGTGTNKTGALDGLQFANALSLKVEMDPTGGTSFETLGTMPLQAVPYATTANMLLATSDGGTGIVGPNENGMYEAIYEGGVYRGYIGSYSGKNSDVDFGTGSGNANGSTHLTIQGTPKLTIDSIGRVGIGTRFPFTDLEVAHGISSGNNKGFSISNTDGTATTNSWTFYTQGSSGNLLLYAGNSIKGTFNRASGAYSTISDLRLKTNIENEGSVLDKVMHLRPVRYQFKADMDAPKTLGLIAQELQKEFPEMVTPFEGDGLGQYPDLLTVDYAGLSVVALKAIQEQQEMIATLQAEVQQLKAEMEILKK